MVLLAERDSRPVSHKLQNALDRLRDILPLKANQTKCAPQVKALHQQLLRSFVERGRILTRAEMATYVDQLPAALDLLRQYDMLTVSSNGEADGAYPFTMHERGHTVFVNGQRVHAMCALDALAVGPMFQVSTHIQSHCAVTSEPIEIRMAGETVGNWEEVGQTHVGIGWQAADGQSCCADSLCMEMIFLRDQEIAGQWLADHAAEREIFTLAEAVQLASRFFVPLMT